ncbi:MAG: DUF945 family protein [Woeseiaceae bacterium]|nr:DUF945 family protein [Woeseiaceae bacterium]
MKKSIVFLLILLALVVLVSPGIVGRLAEQTMDENLDRAAMESAELRVTSRGFERGWFSSAGSHRVEIRDGEIRGLLVALFEPADPDALPALVIDTRLDHGLIPVTSLARKEGSLLPGLGSAVSTVALEFPGGERIPVPGTIYSRIGVTGTLESRYVLPPGNTDADGATLTWGQSVVVVTSQPVAGSFTVRGTLDPLAAEAPDATLLLGELSFEVEQTPTRFGIPVGSFGFELESVGLVRPGNSVTVGPVSVSASSATAGDRIDGDIELRIDNAPLPPLGTAAVGIELALDGADGAALARVQRTVDALVTAPGATSSEQRLEREMRELVGAGLELRLARLDVELPSGTIAASGRAATAETDPAWPAILLATDAELSLKLPAEVADLVTTLYPEAGAMIALGYLRRQDDHYVVDVELVDGTITVNGAPMQLSPGAFR